MQKNKKKLDYKHLKISSDYQYSSDKEQEEEQEEKQEKQDKKPFDLEENIKWMFDKEEEHVNEELFPKYFKFQKPSLMYKVLHTLFNSGFKDLKEEIKTMSKEEIENEKPDEIVRVVEMILDFNKQN